MTFYPIQKYLTLLSILIITSGCVVTGNDSIRSENNASLEEKIKIGNTNKQEVAALLGAPTNSMENDKGIEIWTYEFSDVSPDANAYIPLVGFFSSTASGTKKTLVIEYDKKNIVKNFELTESDITVDAGYLHNE